MRTNIKNGYSRFVLMAAGFLAVAYWLLETMADTWFLNAGTFVERLVPTEPHELFERFNGMSLLLLFGIFAYCFARSREKIQQRLNLSQYALDHASVPIFWSQEDGRIIYANNAACKELGYSSAELLALRVQDIDVDFHVESWSRHWERVRQEKRRIFQTRHRAKNGQIIPVEVTTNHFSYAGKEYHLAFAEDITERLRIEQELTNLARFASENPSPLLRVTSRGVIVFANTAGQSLLAQWQKTIGEHAPSHVVAAVESCLGHGSTCRLEVMHGTRTISFNVVPIMGGEYCNLYGTDVSEQKQAQQQLVARGRELGVLLTAAQSLNTILDTATIMRVLIARAIELIRAGGGTAGLLVGDAMVFREYQTKNGEVLAINYDFTADKGIPGWVMQTHEPYIANDAVHDEHVFKEAQRALGFYDLITVPIFSRAHKLLGCFELHNSSDHLGFDRRDLEKLRGLADLAAVALENAMLMAQQRKAEAALEKVNRQLAEKNAELESIIYVASHDMRSTLVNVQGFSKELSMSCELLHSQIAGKEIVFENKAQVLRSIDVEIPESLGFILTNTAKIDTLLSGLLRLSRVGHQELRIKELQLDRIMADIIKSREFDITQSGAHLTVGALPPCRGDQALITQAFANIVDNALQFLDRSRPGTIHISGRTENGFAIYIVEDNGIGIAAEHLGKIFEVFHRLYPHDSIGEGLGLTIARRIIERHNGRIWVESQLGRGSKFFVSLPT